MRRPDDVIDDLKEIIENMVADYEYNAGLILRAELLVYDIEDTKGGK